jgi:hypothetical protein
MGHLEAHYRDCEKTGPIPIKNPLTRLNLSYRMNRLITGTRAMVTSQALMQKTDYPEDDLIL